MRKVIGIGETVLDIIFRDNQPIQAVPGGSTFNSVISLGRAGVPVKFISEAGNDRVGRQIIQYLEDNGVDATNVCMFPNSKSPISLAFLDEQNNAEYLFYKDHPNDRLDFVPRLCPSAWGYTLLRCQLPVVAQGRPDEGNAEPAGKLRDDRHSAWL